jgi:hypothetical protein
VDEQALSSPDVYYGFQAYADVAIDHSNERQITWIIPERNRIPLSENRTGVMLTMLQTLSILSATQVSVNGGSKVGIITSTWRVFLGEHIQPGWARCFAGES